ncbi:hypothetical protein NRIC0776_00860 [Apilactobacillus kunkeei]
MLSSRYEKSVDVGGCDTPGHFVMKGAPVISTELVVFKIQTRRENNGKAKDSYPFKGI